MLVVLGQEVLQHKTKELKGSPTQPLTTCLDNSPFLKRRGVPSMISLPNCFPGKEFCHLRLNIQVAEVSGPLRNRSRPPKDKVQKQLKEVPLGVSGDTERKANEMPCKLAAI